MKKRNLTLLSTLLIAVLIFASSCTALYNDLASSYAPNNIETFPQSSTTTTSTQGTTSGDGEQTPNEDNPTEDTPQITWNTPDFTVLNQDGNEVKLSDLAGKPIVLNFWATWCVYCTKEMPDFQTAYKKYPNVQFVMVNATDGHYETIDSAKQYVINNNFTFPIYFDTTSSATNAYGVTGFPATFFIDANGNLVAKASGMLSLANLEKGIAMIAGE